jgi:hypothetical protein
VAVQQTESRVMIAPDTIEDAEESDGESVSCYGYDPEADEWRWERISIETLYEHDRQDILRYVGAIRDYDEEEEMA